MRYCPFCENSIGLAVEPLRFFNRQLAYAYGDAQVANLNKA